MSAPDVAEFLEISDGKGPFQARLVYARVARMPQGCWMPQLEEPGNLHHRAGSLEIREQAYTKELGKWQHQ